MLAKLLTESANPAAKGLDLLPIPEMLLVMNSEDEKVAGLVRGAIPQIAMAIDAASSRMARGGSLFYIGAGTSGRLGVLDASECPPTFNVSPGMVRGIIAGGQGALSQASEGSEDDPSLGARDLDAAGFSQADVVCGIAASGRTPYVLGAVQLAGKRGGCTIGISCNEASELSRAVQFPIEVATGAEVVSGSTRLKAGTATKMILNMMSTGIMVRLGHVYDNLMVNLHPKNEKLVDRAHRIVAAAAGIDEVAAAELFREAGSVKTAIVMSQKVVSRETAERILASVDGRLRQALEA